MKKTLEKKLLAIAMKHCWAVEQRGNLKYRMNDAEDFLEISVGAIEAMLEEAYKLGKEGK